MTKARKLTLSQKLLKVSIIIITYNAERTIRYVLESISIQDYPRNHFEILVIDGNSTDKTLSIIKKSDLPIKIIQSPYPDDPEACRAVGIHASQYDIAGFIDADNYMPHKQWLQKMLQPFTVEKEIYGVQTLRYAYRKKDTPLNRYFALLGAADPVGFYLKKDDRLSYLYDTWNLYGTITKREKNHFLVAFDPYYFPTLGCNGFFFRRDLLLKTLDVTPKNFFHIDTPLDMAKKGYDTYAVVYDTVVHDTAGSFLTFLRKRARYMGLHYLLRSSNRRYRVFDPSKKEDVINLLKFSLFSLTFVEPLIFSLRGYIKKRDVVWFIHPIFCFSIFVTYSLMVVMGVFQMKFLKNKVITKPT